ncbi:MAG: CoA pyrophosphatase [Ignavibacteriales bacterium]|nr:CoA pyrophosphatase [Ignavibacteriales bacterium]
MDFTTNEIKDFLARRRRVEVADFSLTRAGVLVPLFRKKNEWYLLMTKRSEEVEHHKGQISFPGGAVDSDDKDIIATALREAEEEIGLRARDTEILGLLDDHMTPTGFMITPVVGFLKEIPKLAPRQEEVLEILEVPVSLFLDSKKERVEKRERLGEVIDVYFYDFGKHEIWGATARISRDFLREIADSKKPL